MKITVITPTCDRPIAVALLERYIERQTRAPDEWIVADGGELPVECRMGQVHVHDPRPGGAINFATNLLNGVASATGDAIIFCEDDDWLRADHIESLAAQLERFPLVGSEPVQRYYNVALRCWRTFDNTGASLCQTGMRRELVAAFVRIVDEQMTIGRYGVDTNFWRSVPREHWGMAGKMTVVGIKGLPGRAGLGIGHRPSGPAWTADPQLEALRGWIGDDVDAYAPFLAPAEQCAC